MKIGSRFLGDLTLCFTQIAIPATINGQFYISGFVENPIINSTAKNDFQFNADAERISLEEYVKLAKQQRDEVIKKILSKFPRGSKITMGEITTNAIELEYE